MVLFSSYSSIKCKNRSVVGAKYPGPPRYSLKDVPRLEIKHEHGSMCSLHRDLVARALNPPCEIRLSNSNDPNSSGGGAH
ncbi:hypothetical protein RSAG8_07596, partial [Rhizoctonia solani AG-8 WAC10335]